MRLLIPILLLAMFHNSGAQAQNAESSWSTTVRAEAGTIGAQNYRIRFGKDGTQFDYLADGGQDILYPYQRFEAEFTHRKESRWLFVYQPLELISNPILRRDVIIDGETFAKDTPMNLRYSFPFYRVSYLSLKTADTLTYGYGASLQIRNASISFTDAKGEKRRTNQNIGPVPAVKLFVRDSIFSDCFWATELDTIYAPVKYLNGSDSDVVGAFTDFSIKIGTNLQLRDSESFVALRYIGGGASGTSKNNKSRSDGFSSNWIDLVSFSLGLSLRL